MKKKTEYLIQVMTIDGRVFDDIWVDTKKKLKKKEAQVVKKMGDAWFIIETYKVLYRNNRATKAWFLHQIRADQHGRSQLILSTQLG